MTDKGLSILSNILGDPKGRWILDHHSESQAEVPITGIIEDKIVHVVLDRTFVDNGVLWIIDYKTGSHEGSIEEFLRSEKLRYESQLDLYASILSQKGETRPIKKGLYFPAFSGWIEW